MTDVEKRDVIERFLWRTANSYEGWDGGFFFKNDTKGNRVHVPERAVISEFLMKDSGIK